MKPGDCVSCSLYPERGPGTITYLNKKEGKAFVIWGKAHKCRTMPDDSHREYCKLSLLTLHKEGGK